MATWRSSFGQLVRCCRAPRRRADLAALQGVRVNTALTVSSGPVSVNPAFASSFQVSSQRISPLADGGPTVTVTIVTSLEAPFEFTHMNLTGANGAAVSSDWSLLRLEAFSGSAGPSEQPDTLCDSEAGPCPLRIEAELQYVATQNCDPGTVQLDGDWALNFLVGCRPGVPSDQCNPTDSQGDPLNEYSFAFNTDSGKRLSCLCTVKLGSV